MTNETYERLESFFRERATPHNHGWPAAFSATQEGNRVRIVATMMSSADTVGAAHVMLRTHLRELRLLLKELNWNYYPGSGWSLDLCGDPDTAQAPFETVWLTRFEGVLGPAGEELDLSQPEYDPYARS